MDHIFVYENLHAGRIPKKQDHISPVSALDCAMNCGWWDGDHCSAPAGGPCYFEGGDP
jgi:hypothetical protein